MVWADSPAWYERCIGIAEAAGSNPAPSTKYPFVLRFLLGHQATKGMSKIQHTPICRLARYLLWLRIRALKKKKRNPLRKSNPQQNGGFYFSFFPLLISQGLLTKRSQEFFTKRLLSHQIPIKTYEQNS
jgi:hypothetical protein